MSRNTKEKKDIIKIASNLKIYLKEKQQQHY